MKGSLGAPVSGGDFGLGDREFERAGGGERVRVVSGAVS